MIDLFISFFTYIGEIVTWWYNLVGAFWTVLIAGLFTLYFGATDFILYLICDYVVGFLTEFKTLVILYDLRLPDPGDNFDFTIEFLSVANYYLPLFEGGIMVAAYVTLATYVWGLRFAIKIIPTIG